MNDLVHEWVRKAEGDYQSALLEYRARKYPNYDAAGFHAQQCIEKYFKAFLQAQQIPVRKIHDLLALETICAPVFPELELHRETLAYLNQFAVIFRYPGESATKAMAKNAVKGVKKLRSLFRQKLDVSDQDVSRESN